jgi:hypothetical protein
MTGFQNSSPNAKPIASLGSRGADVRFVTALSMELQKALSVLDNALAKIPGLRGENAFSVAHTEFIQTTGLDLARIFGPESPPARNFAHIDYQSTGSFIAGMLEMDKELTRRRKQAYLRGLDMAEGIIRSARSQLEIHGADKILTASRIRTEGARAFISHGRKSEALTKLERFLRALGVEPIIVVHGPSEGLSVDDLVEKRMGESDCAIILATGDDEVEDHRQPRPNVIHEIGLAQEKFQNKVVYLKEDGCEFPSNVQPKVWESFTQLNMEAAFEKIIKELRSFGLI